MTSIVLVGLIVIAIHFLHAGRKRATLPGAEESMTTTIEFITALFCQVDDHLAGLPKHPEAHLWPSEVKPCHHFLYSGGAFARLYPVNPSPARNHAAKPKRRPLGRGRFALDMWGLVSVPYSRLKAPRM